jgi:cyclopropane fatty-acyl-phospholipid synthase-like methyltransferase
VSTKGLDPAIVPSLLSDEAASPANPQDPAPWTNFGDWSRTTAYSQAARDLALDAGHAANLQPHSRVLDLACGLGASVELWASHFGVKAIDAVEVQKACTDFIRARDLPALEELHAGRFETFALPANRYDAIISVDAAYHFVVPEPFLRQVARGLRPGGWLVFHALTTTKEPVPHCGIQRLLQAAEIHPEHLIRRSEWERLLRQDPWREGSVQSLREPVWRGFAEFVRRRGPELERTRRLSAGWARIWLARHLCRFLLWEGSVDYVRVAVQKRR